MKKLLYTAAILLSSMMLTSCFSDDTTLATRPLAEIVLSAGTMQEVYNVDKNDVLRITPVYTQTNGGKPVTVTWEIGEKVFSHDETLEYECRELGSWNCRLILENEDGCTFFPFKLHVNSPYEEGITILSQDAIGRPYLAFLPKTLDGSRPEFFPYDCLTKNNDDTEFASYPADIVQCSGTLIFACQGKQSGTDVPTIYYVNEKTLVVENMLTVKEYADFKPTILGIPSLDASGVAYPIICENGKTYEFSTTEGAIVPATKMPYTYAQRMLVYDPGYGWNYDILFWDQEIGALGLIYNGYGPYYLSKNYHQGRETCSGTNNYFDGRQLAGMCLIRMTPQQANTNAAQALVMTKNGMIVQKTVVSTSFWSYNYDTAETVLDDNGGTKMACVGSCPITETTPMIANMTYFSLLFADGNKVRRWYYTTNTQLTQADVLLTVGSSEAVITGFEMSSNHEQSYVSFYEPSEAGMNGHLWIFDTDTGDVIDKYDNICYRPVKMIYKKK